LQYYDFNVIFIDWSEGAQTINYLAARNRVSAVGELVASYIDFLVQNNLLTLSRTSLIGFSLGAHIAGMTGKNVRSGRVNAIIGLDPAGPLFSMNSPDARLNRGDAVYVESIHTNGGLLGAGIADRISNADFWPNGGSSQPGCLTAICHHNRAVDLYVESIIDNRFWANVCDTVRDAERERCTGTPRVLMGGDSLTYNKRLEGIYAVGTDRRSPFALG